MRRDGVDQHCVASHSVCDLENFFLLGKKGPPIAGFFNLAETAALFRAVAEISPRTISLIAIIATLNTILAQMTIASRVIYGLARDAELPRILAGIHPATGTPVAATAVIVASVIPLALLVPFAWLAEGTSLATLVVFALVNTALLKLRYRRVVSPHPHVSVPIWVPALGLVACIAMIPSSLL